MSPLAPAQLLTNHYERCWKYYCLPTGWANFGVTSEEELHLTRKLFWGIFDSLAHKVWAYGGGRAERSLFGGFVCVKQHPQSWGILNEIPKLGVQRGSPRWAGLDPEESMGWVSGLMEEELRL